MSLMTEQLVTIVETLNYGFTLRNEPLPADRALAEVGLLPAIARRGDQLSTLCLGYGIGIGFEEASDSILGVKVVFDDMTSLTLRLLMILDVVEDLASYAIDKSAIALDELLYD